VQIEKKQNHSTPSSLAAKSSGTKVAEEYAATFPTRLALARWTRGGDIPHVHCFEHQLPMRAAWYAQAQRQFQAWLEAGGFNRIEPGSLDGVIAETTHAHHDAPDAVPVLPVMKSFPETPGGERQK
jgi:hypothetical protein